MELAVAVVGALIVLAGIVLLVKPGIWEPLVTRAVLGHIVWVGVGRLALGVFLILASSSCRWPLFVAVVGGIAIASGIGVLIMGQAGVKRVMDWFVGMSVTGIRIWGLFALGFGVLLVRASV